MPSRIWLACVAAIAGLLSFGVSAHADPMWAVIQDGNATMFEHFPTGPSATSTGAYALQIGQQGVDAANFLGAQFLADGSMWAAIQDGNATMLEYFPTGPSATSTGAYALQIGQQGVDAANFLGFQFLTDGSMWAAIQDGNATMFEYFPSGPSATSTGAYALQIGQQGVNPGNLLGFQFLAGPPGSGGAVPEPATWALLIAGFGLAGAALRTRRNSDAHAWGRTH